MDGYDFIGQAMFLSVLLLAVWNRKILRDMEDGNVERLIREERVSKIAAAKARAILIMMQKERVS